jgi:hypothetical protein
MASFRAHLSPNEETTLRRIAIDVLELGDVREADAKRLMALGLIAAADGLLIPTSRGLQRIQIEKPPPTSHQGQRRLKVRKLPF